MRCFLLLGFFAGFTEPHRHQCFVAPPPGSLKSYGHVPLCDARLQGARACTALPAFRGNDDGGDDRPAVKWKNVPRAVSSSEAAPAAAPAKPLDGAAAEEDELFDYNARGDLAYDEREERLAEENLEDEIVESDDGYWADDEREYTRATPKKRKIRRRPTPSRPDAFYDGDLEWYRRPKAQEEGPFMSWLRRLYNTLFWYGAAEDDDDYIPVMNFKDLMEQYAIDDAEKRAMRRNGQGGRKRSGAVYSGEAPWDGWGGGGGAARRRGEEQPAAMDDWTYVWRPGPSANAEKSGKNSAGRRPRRSEESRPPPPPRRSEIYDKYDFVSFDERKRRKNRERQRETAATGGYERFAASDDRYGGETLRGRAYYSEREGSEEEEDGLSPAEEDGYNEGFRKGRGSGGGLERRLVGLERRERALLADLEQVEERLGVASVSLELALRRLRALAEADESPPAISQAEGKVLDLKEEGRRLHNARLQIRQRLENCQGNIQRLREELGIFAQEPAEAASAGVEGQGAADSSGAAAAIAAESEGEEGVSEPAAMVPEVVMEE